MQLNLSSKYVWTPVPQRVGADIKLFETVKVKMFSPDEPKTTKNNKFHSTKNSK